MTSIQERPTEHQEPLDEQHNLALQAAIGELALAGKAFRALEQLPEPATEPFQVSASSKLNASEQISEHVLLHMLSQPQFSFQTARPVAALRERAGLTTSQWSLARKILMKRHGIVRLSEDDGVEQLSIDLGKLIKHADETYIAQRIAPLIDGDCTPATKKRPPRLMMTNAYRVIEYIVNNTDALPGTWLAVGVNRVELQQELSVEVGIPYDTLKRLIMTMRDDDETIEIDEEGGRVRLTEVGLQATKRLHEIQANERVRKDIPEPDVIEDIISLSQTCLELAVLVGNTELAEKLASQQRTCSPAEYSRKQANAEHAQLISDIEDMLKPIRASAKARQEHA